MLAFIYPDMQIYGSYNIQSFEDKTNKILSEQEVVKSNQNDPVRMAIVQNTKSICTHLTWTITQPKMCQEG